jgi:hypothetical protein
MTYNQVIKKIKETLESHAMIKQVIPNSPVNWLFWTEQPTFPNASFEIASGGYNAGRENVYNIQLWLLDKSGVDNEFEQDVTSDMHGIGNDIVNSLRQEFNTFGIDQQISWSKIEEKFEDYLTGVQFTFNLSVVSAFGACDIPTI